MSRLGRVPLATRNVQKEYERVSNNLICVNYKKIKTLPVANLNSYKRNWIQRFWKKLGLQGKVILIVFLICLVYLLLTLGTGSSELRNSIMPHAGDETIPGISP
jgi:hypothetical protein